MPDKKSKYVSFQQFLGKAAGETINEKDIQKGLASTDPHVVKMAKNAEKVLNRKNKISKEEFSELNSTRILSAQITMEAFAATDLTALITDSLPILANDIKEYFNRFVPNQPGVIIEFSESKFIKDVNKHIYTDISPLTAYVPEGLNVTYLKYAEKLLPAAIHASKVLDDVMSHYTIFLAGLINNKDSKLNTISFNKIHEKLTSERNELNSELGKCFKNNSVKAEVTLGDVVDRNSDWKYVIDTTNELMKLINSVNRNTLNKKIKESVTYLDIILDKIERKEMNNTSPEVVDNLSTGAYQVASELEFFSIVYYRILTYVNCVNNTVEHFNKVLK